MIIEEKKMISKIIKYFISDLRNIWTQNKNGGLLNYRGSKKGCEVETRYLNYGEKLVWSRKVGDKMRQIETARNSVNIWSLEGYVEIIQMIGREMWKSDAISIRKRRKKKRKADLAKSNNQRRRVEKKKSRIGDDVTRDSKFKEIRSFVKCVLKAVAVIDFAVKRLHPIGIFEVKPTTTTKERKQKKKSLKFFYFFLWNVLLFSPSFAAYTIHEWTEKK